VPKPYSEACEQNKEPILEVLRRELPWPATVLEIGSGTGQHAVYFAAHLSHLAWRPSDLAENIPGIDLWRAEASLRNLLAPLVLEVQSIPWPIEAADAVFSANTAHIMSEAGVAAMFTGIGRVLRHGGRFCLYGPFSYDGRHTAESNANFDRWLKVRDPRSGVRDVRWLDELARESGLEPVRDYPMPVNNRTLVYVRREA
jgi:cyclopropane fatty-acyl-phospholipid synthase-like methyltransferase